MPKGVQLKRYEIREDLDRGPKTVFLAPCKSEKVKIMQDMLMSDLDFHDKKSNRATHNFHSFPAKFPPQLPKFFIENLTRRGDLVLDPMVGSGTTVVEAAISGRRGIGLDIDPLSVKICQTKSSKLLIDSIAKVKDEVVTRSERYLLKSDELKEFINKKFNNKTKEFIDYWFADVTQLELIALVLAIDEVNDLLIRDFLKISLSSIIITKSGGVSLARDLAHTRPHKDTGKIPKNSIMQFDSRINKNIQSLIDSPNTQINAKIIRGDAANMPLESNSVSLVVTSPPYASNAIDYMRAHKFSLVWFGRSIEGLSELRTKYIGGENTSEFIFENMPHETMLVLQKLRSKDKKKAKVLHKYYSEMRRVLSEMYRVLKMDAAAIVVIGSSVMRGLDTRTHRCFAEIARDVGFELAGIAERRLDRNRRMLPTRLGGKSASIIEQRMHNEYVIGLIKT